MFDLNAYLTGGIALLISACLIWTVSVFKRDVSIVDSFWSIMFVIAFFAYFLTASEIGMRWFISAVLLILWATRLAGYITWRNWGEAEDHRYVAIRKKYEPHFWLKSLFIIFIFQAVLAWIITLPLLAIITGSSQIGILDYIGLTIIVFGIGFESIADWQLHRFKTDPANQGKVMNHGLWRYSRHPNYFGEFCVWWGFFLLAFAAGGWWSVISPLLITFLLLKFSGVSLLEQDITNRRPKYADYIRSTNAFFPGPPRGLNPEGESS